MKCRGEACFAQLKSTPFFRRTFSFAKLPRVTILFVCTGNTCRSPLAVAAWRALESAPDVKVLSAGFAARSGSRAEPLAVAVARTWNVDLSSHRARQLDETLMQSDLICTMTASSAQMLRENFPDCAAKIRVLGEFIPMDKKAETDKDRLAQLLEIAPCELQAQDINDPFGGSLENYQICGAQIQRAAGGLAAALRRGELKT